MFSSFHIDKQIRTGLGIDDKVETLERMGVGFVEGTFGFVDRDVGNFLGAEIVFEGLIVMKSPLCHADILGIARDDERSSPNREMEKNKTSIRKGGGLILVA